MWTLQSFWGQLGPNATTFILAAELFPTELRGRFHGASAAVGKLGALAADVVLGRVSPLGPSMIPLGSSCSAAPLLSLA